MKKIIFSGVCLTFLCVTIAQAQLMDTVAAGALSGSMEVKSLQTTRQGLSMLQQNRIIQNLNRMILDIKMNSHTGYSHLNKASFTGASPFGALNWNVGPVTNTTFFIELDGVDTATCKRLITTIVDYQSVTINGQPAKSNACTNNAKIKWIFE